MKIDQSDAELHQEIVVTRSDGNEDRIVFKCWINGEQNRNSLNGKPLRVSASWQGDELIIESWLTIAEREMHFRDFWSISGDRKLLVMEHRDDDLAGQRTVLERVE